MRVAGRRGAAEAARLSRAESAPSTARRQLPGGSPGGNNGGQRVGFSPPSSKPHPETSLPLMESWLWSFRTPQAMPLQSAFNTQLKGQNALATLLK